MSLLAIWLLLGDRADYVHAVATEPSNVSTFECFLLYKEICCIKL